MLVPADFWLSAIFIGNALAQLGVGIDSNNGRSLIASAIFAVGGVGVTWLTRRARIRREALRTKEPEL